MGRIAALFANHGHISLILLFSTAVFRGLLCALNSADLLYDF